MGGGGVLILYLPPQYWGLGHAVSTPVLIYLVFRSRRNCFVAFVTVMDDRKLKPSHVGRNLVRVRQKHMSLDTRYSVWRVNVPVSYEWYDSSTLVRLLHRVDAFDVRINRSPFINGRGPWRHRLKHVDLYTSRTFLRRRQLSSSSRTNRSAQKQSAQANQSIRAETFASASASRLGPRDDRVRRSALLGLGAIHFPSQHILARWRTYFSLASTCACVVENGGAKINAHNPICRAASLWTLDTARNNSILDRHTLILVR